MQSRKLKNGSNRISGTGKRDKELTEYQANKGNKRGNMNMYITYEAAID